LDKRIAIILEEIEFMENVFRYYVFDFNEFFDGFTDLMIEFSFFFTGIILFDSIWELESFMHDKSLEIFCTFNIKLISSIEKLEKECL